MVFAIAVISAMVAVTVGHELGHFIVAKLLGVPVVHLGVGFGPTLWRGRIIGETQLVVRAIPAGMSVGVVGRREPDGAQRRPIGHDVAVAAAGPLASFAFSIVLILAATIVPAESPWFAWSVGASLLSALVAVLNLVPIPGLDGGHLIILAAAARGWQLSPQQEVRLHRYGLHLMVAVAGAPLLVSLLN